MMSNTPLVSIIIPTFNRAYIIKDALNSIIAQTYTNWECIIVDDGSTDNTNELINSYLKKDSRFKYYKRPKNKLKGPSSCRNLGYEQSEGEFIQWFDSDDVMHPEKLEIKIAYALKHRADVIVDKHNPSINFIKTNDIQFECFASKDFYIDFILGKRPVITNDVMLKRTIIKNNRFDEDLWKGEEYEFFSRIFQQKITYCFLDVVLTKYQISSDSISISPLQVESLITLSKKLICRHQNNQQIIAKAEKQGRKTYKSLILETKMKLVFKHFNFFRKCHHESSIMFFGFMIYNYFTKKGFDIIKP